jgi:hypothetical protein
MGSPGDPAPLERRFIATWCGLAEGTVPGALLALRGLGIIRKVGTHKSRGRIAALYLPALHA